MTAKTTHAFETEANRLLHLVIHSLYTNKEVFLRELISNASDALDKRRFEGLKEASLLPDGDLSVRLETTSDPRTLVVSDNGIGMTRDELVENLGTIARSGTAEFRGALEKEQADALIGQFGVGFYAAFMVANKVTVLTRKAGTDEATQWESEGDGSFTIEDGSRSEPGTTITLQLRDVDEENGLRDFTQEWMLRELIRQYSDFVAYPIQMEVERHEPVLDKDGKPVPGSTATVKKELETLNSMKAIWTRAASDVTDEEYAEFYRHVSHDWNPPAARIVTSLEGTIEAKALLYLPSKAPFDLYHREMKKRGVQLYVRRVFIMDDCEALLPDYLRFVKGVVDAADLTLNVSRETLQQDRQVLAIKRHLTKKVLDKLAELCRDDREAYEALWAEFGPAIKEGLLAHDGPKDKILDLALFPSTHGDGAWTTLGEYLERKAESQEAIYYQTGSSKERALQAPQLEGLRERGVEVILLTDPVDEVWLQGIESHKDAKFQSAAQGDGNFETESTDEDKKAIEEADARLEPLTQKLRAALQEEVKEVRLSRRLKSSAVCLVTEEGELSPQMEWLMRQSGQEVPKVKRVLEINPAHPVVDRLEKLAESDATDNLERHARLLYGQAVLAEGGQLPEPALFAQLVSQIQADALSA